MFDESETGSNDTDLQVIAELSQFRYLVGDMCKINRYKRSGMPDHLPYLSFRLYKLLIWIFPLCCSFIQD